MKVVREALAKKVTSEKRPKGSEGASHMDMQREVKASSRQSEQQMEKL